MRKMIAGAALSLVALTTACGSGAAAPATQDEQPALAAPTPQRDDDCPIIAGTGPQQNQLRDPVPTTQGRSDAVLPR